MTGDKMVRPDLTIFRYFLGTDGLFQGTAVMEHAPPGRIGRAGHFAFQHDAVSFPFCFGVRLGNG